MRDAGRLQYVVITATQAEALRAIEICQRWVGRANQTVNMLKKRNLIKVIGCGHFDITDAGRLALADFDRAKK